MRKIRVLVIQYKVRYLKVKSNLTKISRIIRRYKYLNPDLIVFPEYSLTGPLYSNYKLAMNSENEILIKLSSLAKKYRIFLIPGSFIRKIGNNYFNSSCLITSAGKILGYYNKENLWSSERRYLKSGTSNFIFRSSIGNISIQICADLHSSIISLKYRKSKPDLIINIAMWSQEDIKACIKYVPNNIEFTQTEQLAKARALENRCYMVFCNFGGSLEVKANSGKIYKETSIGNSMIISPFGEIIVKTTTNKEEVIFSEVDLSKCHWSKYTYA